MRWQSHMNLKSMKSVEGLRAGGYCCKMMLSLVVLCFQSFAALSNSWSVCCYSQMIALLWVTVWVGNWGSKMWETVEWRNHEYNRPMCFWGNMFITNLIECDLWLWSMDKNQQLHSTLHSWLVKTYELKLPMQYDHLLCFCVCCMFDLFFDGNMFTLCVISQPRSNAGSW